MGRHSQKALAMFKRIRRIVQQLRTGNRSVAPKHAGHDLAHTIRDTSQVAGGFGRSATAPNNAATEMMAKGSGDYAKSFKKK